MRNPLKLGPCGQVWRGEATAAGQVEGLTTGPAEELKSQTEEGVCRPEAQVGAPRGQLDHS